MVVHRSGRSIFEHRFGIRRIGVLSFYIFYTWVKKMPKQRRIFSLGKSIRYAKLEVQERISPVLSEVVGENINNIISYSPKNYEK